MLAKRELDALNEVDERFLHYRVLFGPEDALTFVRQRPEYNLATPERLEELITDIGRMVPPMQYGIINGQPNPNNGRTHHEFYIGREYSRVLYLEIVKTYMPKYWNWETFDHDLKQLANLAMTNEFEANHNEYNVSYRFWWD